ncbi:MAG: pseudouridine synthase, partial [Bacteroidetes bacterium]
MKKQGGYRKSNNQRRTNKPYKKENKSLQTFQKNKNTAAKNIERNDGKIRLNKYIADAGICSRREADKLIASGAITVNGKVVTELGTKVSVTDQVQLGNDTLNREALMYVLLNKPKDYITTTNDPQNRRTVMDLVKNACKERIYPVGRLDRNTTGI